MFYGTVCVCVRARASVCECVHARVCAHVSVGVCVRACVCVVFIFTQIFTCLFPLVRLLFIASYQNIICPSSRFL
jgi:hypothetical protein